MASASESMSATEEFAAYLPHTRRRWLALQVALQQGQQEAWAAARQMAALTRRRFAAEQVIALGSLVHTGRSTERSDLDVEGLQPVAIR